MNCHILLERSFVVVNFKEIGKIRREYKKDGLLEQDVHADPFEQFKIWFDEALEEDFVDSNSMTLSTATKDGKPSARIVLLKGIDDEGFIFYTNYESRKGIEIAENPDGFLSFYWPSLIRQVKIEGKLEKLTRKESEEYFHSRPYESQVAALVSPQSRPISRDGLEEEFHELLSKYRGKEVPLPEFWGGYRLRPNCIEFWQGRPMRLHDRLIYTLEGNTWRIERLAP